MIMKIFLIGLPGSGKSTIGKSLALELAFPFIDLDTEIEKQEGRTIKQIFKQMHEGYFRQLESKALKKYCQSADSFVMATGGGAPCFHQGIDIINQTGLSVFLDVSIDTLLKRLHANTDRPLLNVIDAKDKDEKLLALRTSRLSCYQQAHVTVVNPTFKKLEEAIQFRK